MNTPRFVDTNGKPLTFRKATREFCLAAQEWAAQQPNLRTAWATCQTGAWLAWWLHAFRGVPTTDIQAVRNTVERDMSAFVDFPSSRFHPLQPAYAKALREEFTMNGQHRVRS